MWIRRMTAVLAVGGLLPSCWAVEAVAWGDWMRERREAIYRDQPAEVDRLARQAEMARAAGDELTWGLLQGVRLMVLSRHSDAAAESLAKEVAAALERQPAGPAAQATRLSLALGLARYRQDVRDTAGLPQALEAAQAVADASGQPAMQAEVAAARALHRVYEGDAPAAETLSQQALAASQDPLLRLEVFLGPQAIARILSINTPEAAQTLLADLERALAGLDAGRYPYMAVNLGVMKAIVLRRVLKPEQAQQELDRWLAFAGARPGFVLTPTVRNVQAGLFRDLKNWSGCTSAATPLTSRAFTLVQRIDAFMTLAICQAEAQDRQAAAQSLAELDGFLPGLQGSPAMVEAVLAAQSRAYEILGDAPAALKKLKAQRQAMVARYAKANEASRKQIEAAYQVAAKDKENLELKAREALSEQRRITLGVALGVALVGLLVVAELLRRRSAQRRRLAEMASNLAQVNAELSAANQRLHDLNASRTRLVAAACHDLRQPAHALGMLAEIASAKARADERQTLDAIRRSSTSLSELLDALFDLSRLESDRYVPTVGPVALGELLAELRTQFAVAAHSKGLALHVDEVDAMVRSDSHLLRRMVMNLLSNAIKYTAAGEVAVHVQRQGGDCVLSVRDTGPGMTPEQQASAFIEYVRLDTSRGTDGLGIGLAIVRRSADLLGHPLALTSSPGRGSCFTLQLPAVEATTAPVEPVTTATGVGQVIGLVDDDEQIREAMQELLTLHGYRPMPAPSLEALQQVMAAHGVHRPQLVLSDFHLAAGDSLEPLAALVGDRGPWAGVPAVLITGDLSGDVLARCEALGITVAYKPLPARKLTQLMARLLAEAPASG